MSGSESGTKVRLAWACHLRAELCPHPLILGHHPSFATPTRGQIPAHYLIYPCSHGLFRPCHKITCMSDCHLVSRCPICTLIDWSYWHAMLTLPPGPT